MRFSACIEMLFVEIDDVADRIRAAKAAGLDAVEFWRWTNKDIGAVRGALEETGLTLAGVLAEPTVMIGDPRNLGVFVEGIRASVAAARELGTDKIIVLSGDAVPGIARSTQRAAIVAALGAGAAAAAGSGVTLVLEPLNDRVDHKGYFLTSTREAIEIIREVARPELKLLYDIYHSAVMGEATEDVLAGAIDLVGHVHLADAPGRHEPGSGSVTWQARLDWLRGLGYGGLVGLEYRPTGTTLNSLEFRAAVR